MDDRIEQLLNGQHYKRFQETAYAKLMQEYGLTTLDVRVLLFLEEHGSNNTAKDIVKMHFLTKSNVSKSIEALLERGYLKREYDSHDRRCIHLQVQQSAAPVIVEAKKCQQEMFRTIFQGVSEEELEVLRQVSQKIAGNIAEVLQGERRKESPGQ